jgi:formiminoglutamase
MTKPDITQSQKRFSESLGALFLAEENSLTQEKLGLFLKSSSDEGVIRNGGRNGARFAPQSLLAYFKKLTQDDIKSHYRFREKEVSRPELERIDFALAQEEETRIILAELQKSPQATVCHLGGGHDHIYPLLKAYSVLSNDIHVINIDAHADTRSDETAHSGTPFRQFAQEYAGSFHLHQIGLQHFANSFSTLLPLEQGQTSILWREDLDSSSQLDLFFAEIEQKLSPKSLIIFSLDADALQGQEVPGVSAVNGYGISRSTLQSCWRNYRKISAYHAPILGLYELNPVFDTLSMLSMRTLGSFLFEVFE